MSAKAFSPRRHRIPELDELSPVLIIFDKGGTLTEFRGLWSAWIRKLARRVESATGLPMAGRLFHAMGFDPGSGRIDPAGRLATGTMADLRALTVNLLGQAGLPRQASDAAIETAWFAPDPVGDVRPLADLPGLFTELRDRGIKIAVATMDDRAPTEATFAALGVEPFVDALVCGDDGLSPKPAPDMVWAVCQATGVEPAQAIVVGDSATDLEMGRAAGAGLVVGVLSGVAPEEMLATHADVLLASVVELLTSTPGIR
jgi:phosphoglycolate phosphatase